MAEAAERRFQNGNGSRNFQLPIYYLLKRNNLMTIMNVHRTNWQTRGQKILIMARPVAEYHDFIQYFIDPVFDSQQRLRRQATDFPYFRPMLRQDQSSNKALMLKTNPTLFIMEFRRTRAAFNDHLGNPKVLKMVKQFYKDRCQHTEWTGNRCDNCGEAENAWKNDTRRSIQNEVSQALETEPLQEMFLEDGDWSTRIIDESAITENTILVTNFEERITTSGREAMIANAELIRQLNIYRGRMQQQD